MISFSEAELSGGYEEENNWFLKDLPFNWLTLVVIHMDHVCFGTGSMAPLFMLFAFLVVDQKFGIGLIFSNILLLNVNDAIKM